MARSSAHAPSAPVLRLRSALSHRARPWLRDHVADLLHRSGVTRADRVAAGRLTIVTFHRVLPAERKQHYPYPGLAVTPDELSWMLTYFAREYQVGSLRESLADWQREPDDTRPRMALTFDDGQLDNYEHARPVLARHNVHATFYLPVRALESGDLIWHDRLGFALRDALQLESRAELSATLHRVSPAAALALDHMDAADLTLEVAAAFKRLDAVTRSALVEQLWQRFVTSEQRAWAGPMSWAQARELADEGHEIGSHSVNHLLLTRCSDAELDHEMRDSRRVLEEKTGTGVDSLCYPDGNHDSRTQRAARSAEYANAVTTRSGSNPRDANRFALRRYDMTSHGVRTRNDALSVPRLAFRLSGLGRSTT